MGPDTRLIDAHLTAEDTWELCLRVRDANRPGAAVDEETLAAPDTVGEDDGEAFWFAGATDEQMQRFLAEGIWQVENEKDSVSLGLVSQISVGDRIAAKASFVQKRGLPFDVGGKPVSVMRIKAIGTVLEPLNNGKGVRVDGIPASIPEIGPFLYICPNSGHRRSRQ